MTIYIPNPEEDCDTKIIANSPVQERPHEWNVASEMPCDTLSYSYQQLVPIIQTHFDYYSAEDPVSVDSFTSSDDDSASTVILLKTSVEVNVDDPDPHDQQLSSLSQLQALPDHDYYHLYGNDNLIKPKYGQLDVNYPNSQCFLNDGAFHISKSLGCNFDKTCEEDFTQNKRETSKSINVHNESAKSSTPEKTPVSLTTAYSSLNKGNFITTMTFI